MHIGHSKCRPARCFEQIAFRQRIDYLLSQLFSELSFKMIQMLCVFRCSSSLPNSALFSMLMHIPCALILNTAHPTQCYTPRATATFTNEWCRHLHRRFQCCGQQCGSNDDEQFHTGIPFRVSFFRSRAFQTSKSPPFPFHSPKPLCSFRDSRKFQIP